MTERAGQDRYETTYNLARSEPDRFWLEAAQDVTWHQPPSQALREEGWFAGATLNACANALDRHVDNGAGDRLALVYDSPVTGSQRRYTYAQMRDEVALVAGMLRDAGVNVGDRVIIYMPMVPEAVFAMLACARIGAIHSVVFGGFAAAELAKRIDDAEPKLVLAASCGIEPGRIVHYKPLLDEAIALARHKPETCIILQRAQSEATLEPGRDRDWMEARAAASPAAPVPVPAGHPLYILYTSGTTGVPKGVVRDTGGHAVALIWSLRHVFGAKPGDVFWAASDVGWVVGHSFIVYAPLFLGCTTLLYEGKPVGTPDAGAFWRVIREHGVDIFFTAPTAIRAVRREDPDASLLRAGGKGRLRALLLAGERADPDTVRWAEQMLQVPVIDNWWQTELGWPALATCLGLGRSETLAGSAGHPVPGYHFAVLDANHQPLGPEEMGDIAIELPLPPGCFPTLWRNAQGFEDSYHRRHPGYYATGDAGFIDKDGRVHIMSRTDDIINVAGHRLSTASIEQIVAAHPAIAECAVIGAADSLKGQVPVALAVKKAHVETPDDALVRELVANVREQLGPVAAFRAAALVERLPKTRSGKILRSVLRDLSDGRVPRVPPTIEDASAIDVARDALRSIGFPQQEPTEPKREQAA